ncbi:MAG: ABC transporter permease [Saprospiraceae bacterium]|nr:ABC transporter permease [Saprospiraceae bacterium]
MISYIFKQIGLGIISVVFVAIIICGIVFYSPVDPARMSFGQRSDEETIQLFKKKYFLDQPLHIQVFRFFEDLSPIQWISKDDLRLNDYSYKSLSVWKDNILILKKPYGRQSYSTGKPVFEMIAQALPSTFALAFISILCAVFLGLILGFISALHVHSKTDKFILAFCSLSYAIPSYVSSLIIVILFAFVWGNITGLPIQGSLWEFSDEGELQLQLKNLILPVLALGIRPVSMIAQMTRVASLDVIQSDFVRTARAKGINNIKLIYDHLLPNCINPILTTISSWFASLLAGSFFVEFVFNYKGLGLLTISALNQFDVPLILGCCIVVVIIFVIVNLITDLLYAYFDPRIRIA